MGLKDSFMSNIIDFGITTDTLDLARANAAVEDPAHGALLHFIGVVRSRNQGRDVLGVSYDAFEPLCLETLEDICKQAQQQWGPLNIYAWHHKGRLEVGGISLILAVSSPHRGEAYAANRFLIEEIKHRVPVWKQEHYTDGDSAWTEGCELCSSTHEH